MSGDDSKLQECLYVCKLIKGSHAVIMSFHYDNISIMQKYNDSVI